MTDKPSVVEALSAVMNDVQAVRLPEKILRRLVLTDDGCWVWQGALANGYGRVRYESQSRLVHRVVYSLLYGEPLGLDLDHLCRNRACANPAHLEAVTHTENIRRGEWSKGAAALQLSRTTCPQGHPLSGDNVYVPPASSRRQRQCRTCRLAAKRRYNARKRAAA